MDSEKAKAKLSAVAEELGRKIRVFTNPAASAESNEATAMSASELDEPDDFYEFTPADYYRAIANKMGDQFLKTRKFREAEAAKRRSRITKAVMRVRFPDNYTLEVKFQPSETIQCLVDLLRKVLARPDLPFYLYTTPPKERIKDMSKDFYSAGFAPGAIVYFSYDLPKDDDRQVANSGLFLRDEILSLNGLDLVPEQSEVTHSAPEPVVAEPPPPVRETKAEGKKPVKPKWLKL